mmetsp:Transcript_11468/g.13598  ORF Transcript_11468/g.13598 Transcript_11468/m.13598 type:complete len:164 (-) Transcript_11468:74-565(-)|eukprot:CAMPEP_0197848172 /NCGR_PEP_ID=MMETSP1438-20131217/7964_1 /TAXON_ID=1461541 /ORGANISM="Pterosperma sp., Strain CCMP1384" /LENGTH=163 /DNA_ID=CAMNT_0043460311 /DNA_START=157 /DNA_END=648 /DNA_ORIENTATION=+
MGKNKGKSKKAPIFKAVDDGDLDGVVECLKEDPKNRDLRNKDGWTPLHAAAYNGELQIMEALLKAGAKVNDKDHDGDTPVHYASAQGNIDCIRLLARKKCDLEAVDNDGESPVDVAQGGKVKQVIRELMKTQAEDEDDSDDGEWEEVRSDDEDVTEGVEQLKV